MRKYIVIGLLLMIGKGMATGALPLDIEVCKGGILTESQKGDASVSIEDGNSCEREVSGDPVDIFGLWRVEWCDEKTGNCTITQYESPIDKEKDKLLLGRGDKPYKDRAKGFDCVTSVSFSSIFSSLGACSPGGSSSGDKPNAEKSPKPDPSHITTREFLKQAGKEKLFSKDPNIKNWELNVVKRGGAKECTFSKMAPQGRTLSMNFIKHRPLNSYKEIYQFELSIYTKGKRTGETVYRGEGVLGSFKLLPLPGSDMVAATSSELLDLIGTAMKDCDAASETQAI